MFFSPGSGYPSRTGEAGAQGRHWTHLGVVGGISLVIRVGEAHPSWGLKVQHIGNLYGRRKPTEEGSPTHPSARTPPRDPRLQLYQVPRIGVVLQRGTIWLHLKRRERTECQGPLCWALYTRAKPMRSIESQVNGTDQGTQAQEKGTLGTPLSPALPPPQPLPLGAVPFLVVGGRPWLSTHQEGAVLCEEAI